MKTLAIRIVITIIATLTAILFILFSSLYPDYSITFLSIEIVLLPAVYIIGNYCIEDLLNKEYLDLMGALQEKIEKINEELSEKEKENIGLEKDNIQLRTILDINFGVNDETEK